MEIKPFIVFKFNEFGNVAAPDLRDGLTVLAAAKKDD
jgi:hypothetical protein